MANDALYKNEWYTPIEHTPDWKQCVLEKENGTRIIAPHNDITFACAKIDAILVPTTNDSVSNKYINQHVIIINPVELEDYPKIGLPNLNATPDNPAFYILCDDGHQAIAFCNELIIDNIPLNNNDNLYYSRIETEYNLGSPYVEFAPGPERKNQFNWNTIDPILKDLNTSYQKEAIEGGYYISNNITEDDIKTAIKKQNMIPRPMSLLSLCWMRCEVGIDG